MSVVIVLSTQEIETFLSYSCIYFFLKNQINYLSLGQRLDIPIKHNFLNKIKNIYRFVGGKVKLGDSLQLKHLLKY